ncbi:tumor necrosis factor receptor superfamily member 5-like [Heptranchias perlo]|uniref:tumor necrosis factor receptor superfamily member 5-like n=1 Tax=Heptranchias perlo TaxID=212740 RepID=UPI00355AC437
MRLLQNLWLLIPAIQLYHCESATKCNNITQYLKFSRCCAKCPPGSYLINECTIQNDTDCKRCEEGQYQTDWSLADHCQLHMYCDPNGGFVTESPGNTMHNTVCLCAIGKHCINKDCEMCVEDMSCEPGSGVVVPADRKLKNTVCKQCKNGYYSNVSSPVEHCWKWTNCESQGELKPGNSTTDVKCKPWPAQMTDKTAAIVISVLATAILVALVAAAVHRRDYLKQMMSRFHKQRLEPIGDGKANDAAVILPETNGHGGEQPSEETSFPIPETQAEEQSLIIPQQEDGKESHFPEQEQAPLPNS